MVAAVLVTEATITVCAYCLAETTARYLDGWKNAPTSRRSNSITPVGGPLTPSYRRHYPEFRPPRTPHRRQRLAPDVFLLLASSWWYPTLAMTHGKNYGFSTSLEALVCRLAFPQGVILERGQKICFRACNFNWF